MITLDLLPPAQKRQLRLATMTDRWQQALVTAALVTVIVAAATVAELTALRQRANRTHRQLETIQASIQKDAALDITARTDALNTAVKVLQQVLGRTRSWSDDIAKIIAILPPGVTLSSLDLQTNGQVRLEGLAATRQSFLALDKALKNDKQLSNVTTTSVPAKRTNLPFTYSASLVTTN